MIVRTSMSAVSSVNLNSQQSWPSSSHLNIVNRPMEDGRVPDRAFPDKFSWDNPDSADTDGGRVPEIALPARYR